MQPLELAVTTEPPDSLRQRWARLRFAIIGPLLAAPPEPGALRAELKRLAAETYRHPVSGEAVRFGFSTLERWFYAARRELDPMTVLRNRPRRDAGRSRRLPPPLAEALRAQYARHPGWSMQLHADNLAALIGEDPALGPAPSYATVRRYMVAHGLSRQRRRRRGARPGAVAAERHRLARETRSYEVAHFGALWHADAHMASRRVLTADGRWVPAHLIGFIDDFSRLICHAQWYDGEQAETFAHALGQAIAKHGLPRALLTDNGGAECAAEVTEGLARLGIVHEKTLSYSPEQNGKQEVFWGQVEGRLLAMLESVEPLTLEILNDATAPWVALDYNRTPHREIGASPLERYRTGPDVSRPSPDAATLRAAFRMTITRAQRHSDGTCSIEGTRFEVPAAYRHLRQLRLRYARWDRSAVALVDPHTDAAVATLYPLDKQRNAEAGRRLLEPIADEPIRGAEAEPLPPLLRRLMAEYAATGLPPAYIPFDAEEAS